MEIKMQLILLLVLSVVAVVNSEKLKDKAKINVVTIVNEPYYFKRGGQYVGLIPDLLRELGMLLGVSDFSKFNISLSPDGRYGASDAEGKKWTGMIGELISGKADLCAAPLTMTSKREKVIDFVRPYQDIGLTIVVKKSYLDQHQDTTWPINFSIFRPLAVEVWLLVTILVIVVGGVMWVINRFNPYEWGARYNSGLASETQGNSFSIVGSFWFVFTTLQWQGYERSPRSISARVLMCFWFAFVTVTLVTYTGGIVNQLFWASTVHGKDPTKSEIIDLEHLVNHGSFEYGTLGGGSTYNYLMTAKGREFDAIRRYFNTSKGQANIFKTTGEAMEKVRSKKKFALILESVSALHESNKLPCDVTTAGGIFAKRSFGMAVPQKKEYLEELHHAIMDLRESGVIEELERKWFVDNAECWNVSMVEREISKTSALFVNTPKQVDLSMFTGPLILMILGIIFAILVTVAEVFYFKYKGRYDPKNQHGGRKLQMDDGPDD